MTMRVSSRSGLVRWAAVVPATVAVLLLVSLIAISAPAFALPEGRHYEMVSPPYKGGYDVRGVLGVAPSGESVEFYSVGGFAGLLSGGGSGTDHYLARRGADGWGTVSVNPPAGEVDDTSENQESVLADDPLGPNVGVQQNLSTEEEFLLHNTLTPETVENWSVFGGLVLKPVDEQPPVLVTEAGASPELCHVILGYPNEPLLPEAEDATLNQLYDLDRGCGGEKPSLRLVAVKNKLGPGGEEPEPINRKCPMELGIGNEYSKSTGGENAGEHDDQESAFDAVGAGGSEIFFTNVVGSLTSTSCAGNVFQLFVRLGGRETVEVSRPLEVGGGETCTEVPCAGAAGRASAYFAGASEDGSRVFFATRAPLTGDVQDTSTNLYMAGIGCPGGVAEACQAAEKRVVSLVQVSHDPNGGEAADVQGVAKVARDGSHVYFVARGVLSRGSNAEGHAPVSGADNLYVYDSGDGSVQFVADLCSGPGSSGMVADTRCPTDLASGQGADNDTGLWGSAPEAQTNSCPEHSAGCEAGRFLVFSTYGQLVKGDTDTAKDVYRYDAVTGLLNRVSLGEDGNDANGNDDAADATIPLIAAGSPFAFQQYELQSRAISEDGSRIVFSSAGPLSASATNGLTNVYEWHKEPGWSEGVVSIVSSGSAEESDEDPVISASGRDVFFTTVAGLVAEDTDGQRDIYDARLGGGFPVGPASLESCEGDSCQGALTNPAPLLVPGSVSQETGGNYLAPTSTPVPVSSVKKPAKVKKKPKKKKGARKKAKRTEKSNRERRVK